MHAVRRALRERVPVRLALRERMPSLLAQAVAVLVLVAGTTAFITSVKDVTLTIDGTPREVRSTAQTVGELLGAEGVTIDTAHDLVTPAPGQRLRDGERVVVRYGRPVELTVDGRTRTVWTTARNVEQALVMLGVRADGASLSASRSRSIGRGGIELEVRMPRHVTVLADGKRHEVTTTAPTVGEALAATGVSLRPRDRVSVDLHQPTYAEQVIAVTRVDGRRVTKEKRVPFATVQRRSSKLYEGTTRVVKQGKVGIHVQRFVVTLHDGKRHSRQLVAERMRVRPVKRVILVGTKERPENAPSADGLNWAALAACESGGNPQAVNSAGPYYGLYQFMASTWASVGGSGIPTDYSAAEQTYRAQLLYRRSGAGQWPHCGPRLFN